MCVGGCVEVTDIGWWGGGVWCVSVWGVGMCGGGGVACGVWHVSYVVCGV